MDNEIHMMLANIWFFIISLMLLLYVVLDGFDLGVGVLSLFTRNARHSAIMMTSLESIWDANETWLVLLGGSLFGAFPLVFATALHELYRPVMIMLFALIFRGFAFEFRHHSRNTAPWNLLFGLSSLLASLAQGFAFGGLIGGLLSTDGGNQGSAWLTSFSMLVAVGVVAGYALLGATYLMIKTEGELQSASIFQAGVAAILQLSILIAVLIWIPSFNPYFATRCADPVTGRYLLFFLLLAALAFLMLLRALHKGYEISAFIWSVLMSIAAFIVVIIGYYPYMAPGAIVYYDAASPSKTLIFMLFGIGFLMPVMLIYSGYQYLVFRGKIRLDDHLR